MARLNLIEMGGNDAPVSLDSKLLIFNSEHMLEDYCKFVVEYLEQIGWKGDWAMVRKEDSGVKMWMGVDVE